MNAASDFSGDFPEKRKPCERLAPDCEQKFQFQKKSILKSIFNLIVDTKISYAKRGGCVGYVCQAAILLLWNSFLVKIGGPGSGAASRLKGASVGGNTKSDPKPGVLPPIKQMWRVKQVKQAQLI